ncbi:MAG: succinate dehydrogenase cytochrome b subunit [Bdellovibrionales bacterium]
MSVKGFWSSTIGKKQIVGVCGLLLTGFLLTHMLANLLILFSAELYNWYSYKLISNPLIYIAEAGLIALFALHVINAIRLQLTNKSARDSKYAVDINGEKGISFASKTMIHTGMIILIFTVYHLITFKFGTYYSVSYDGQEMRDLHRLVLEVFQSPIYTIGYVVALALLGFHLSHGIASAIKTVGFNHPAYNKKVELGGAALAWVIAGGFIVQPLYVFFIH